MRLRSTALVALLGLAVAGAGPQKRAPAPQSAEDFPIPPIPPAEPPPFQVAPMPDVTLSGPLASPSAGPQLRPDFFNQKPFNAGQGYLPGSSIEGQQEQRQRPVPGINLRMPLQ